MREGPLPFAIHLRLALDCLWNKLLSHLVGDLRKRCLMPYPLFSCPPALRSVCPCCGLTECTDSCRDVLLLRWQDKNAWHTRRAKNLPTQPENPQFIIPAHRLYPRTKVGPPQPMLDADLHGLGTRCHGNISGCPLVALVYGCSGYPCPLISIFGFTSPAL